MVEGFLLKGQQSIFVGGLVLSPEIYFCFWSKTVVLLVTAFQLVRKEAGSGQAAYLKEVVIKVTCITFTHLLFG